MSIVSHERPSSTPAGTDPVGAEGMTTPPLESIPDGASIMPGIGEPTQPASTDPGRKKSRRGLCMGGIAAGFALVGGAVYGVNQATQSNKDHALPETNPTPVVAGPVVPGPVAPKPTPSAESGSQDNTTLDDSVATPQIDQQPSVVSLDKYTTDVETMLNNFYGGLALKDAIKGTCFSPNADGSVSCIYTDSNGKQVTQTWEVFSGSLNKRETS